MNGIGFVFNNQTVLILLLLAKTVCGIDLLSFKVHANPIYRLFARHEKCLMGRLTDVSRMSHWFFRVRVCILGLHSQFMIRLDVA